MKNDQDILRIVFPLTRVRSDFFRDDLVNVRYAIQSLFQRLKQWLDTQNVLLKTLLNHHLK